MPDRGSTRDEIMTVAMRMFVDQGYDKTSLREIAEEIGVTKAALYYHFPTKEDIVHAALAAHTQRVDAILAMLAQTPPGPERDGELVESLQHLFEGESALAMRFGQVNPTAMAREKFGEAHVAQIKRLMGLITEGHAEAESDIRAVLAFGALIIGTLGGGPEAALVMHGSRSQQHEASRRIALDLLAGIREPRG